MTSTVAPHATAIAWSTRALIRDFDHHTAWWVGAAGAVDRRRAWAASRQAATAMRIEIRETALPGEMRASQTIAADSEVSGR
jgi:hypothetical protein